MILIHRATIINEGRTFEGSVLIEGEKIKKIFYDEVPKNGIISLKSTIFNGIKRKEKELF
jgi:dihydroorotase-like cyclic amidohydrolase